MTEAPDTEVPDTDWLRNARCRGLEPDQFFVRGSAQSKRAIRICQRCLVRSECLQYALDTSVEFGIWGGMTERQRRALARRMAS